MSPTRTPPRTVDADAGPRSPGLGDRVAWTMSGVWAVVQGVVLSFAVVMLLTVVAVLGAPGTGTADGLWEGASRVAGGLWLLGHGAPVVAGGITYTFVPLGIGALALFTTYVSAKRSALPSVGAVVAGTLTYVALTGGGAAAGGLRGTDLVMAVVGGLVVGGTGMVVGVLAQPDAPRVGEVSERVFGVVPPVARLGVRAGALALALVTGVSALLVGGWTVAGRTTTDDVVATLAPGWIGGVVLALAQLAVVPNLVVWASAWLAGPGFAVGQGTSFAPGGVVDGPLPALPVLGALPGPHWTGGGLLWAPAVVVLCGVVAGWFAWRRLEPSLVRWTDVAQVVAGVAVTTAAGTALLQLWAGGAAGAGRLAQVGADPLVTAGLVAAETVVGAAVVVVTAHLVTARRSRER
ncbi:hypothetical protein DNL40_00705 [Xylanimonas oleitrophica]|uniref:Uncharacterized protein n=1 Tax=Xylanimonas oleitrophica TaxID=2607479 RepID=A0A2W5WWH9_9MICO|nr:DUF6350 family protein [Xylanimonas oleitrophica]PZR54953.1 hypothetical protein DNL40_00705 [Xylanimonas oleitrophica]